MRTNTSSGFTLVEVMIVSPLIILFIGAFVGLLVTLTGDSLRLRETNAATYNVQDAIDDMQTNASGALGFLSTTGTVQIPQGKDSTASPITNTDSGQPDALIIKSPATTKNPIDSSGEAIYSGIGSCNSQNPVYAYTTIYMVVNKTLYKRTILQQSAACKVPWQRNSCKESDVSTYPSVCQTTDEKLLENVESLDIQYYSSSYSTNPLGDNLAESATSISIAITLTKTVSGDPLSYSGSARVSSANIQPGSNQSTSTTMPAIVAEADSANPYTTNFTWDAAGNAKSYAIRYRPNSSASWSTATINVTNPSQMQYTYGVASAARKQMAQIEVSVNTGGGTYDYGTMSRPVDRWSACNIGSYGWSNYNNGYVQAGFTKTTTGIVGLRGLVQGGPVGIDTVICQLPVGFRPASRLTFPVMINPNVTGRVDVDEQGRVMATGANTGWTSLDSIMFPAAGASGITIASGTWENSGPNWQWYGNDSGVRNYNTGQYMKDSFGRAYVYGVGRSLNSGSYVFNNNIMYTSGSSFGPTGGHLVFQSPSVTYQNASANGYLYARGGSSSWIGFSQVYIPSGAQTMTNLALAAPWVHYNYGGYADAKCHKGNDDIVVVQGLVKYGANGVNMANLNSQGCGLMADGRQIFIAAKNDESSSARIDIDTAGNIVPSTSDTNWTSLSNIHFIAD